MRVRPGVIIVRCLWMRMNSKCWENWKHKTHIKWNCLWGCREQGQPASTWHVKWQGQGKEHYHQSWEEISFWGQFLLSLVPEAKQTAVKEFRAGSLLKSTKKSLMFTQCSSGTRRRRSEKAAKKLSSFFEVILFKVWGFLPVLWAGNEPPDPSEKSAEERISWISEYP